MLKNERILKPSKRSKQMTKQAAFIQTRRFFFGDIVHGKLWELSRQGKELRLSMADFRDAFKKATLRTRNYVR